MSTLEQASATRLHVVIAGACNSGKSTIINMLTGQQTALVSDMPGTTTDPVSKAMELPGIGAAVIIDTAGLDDTGTLGAERIEASRRAMERADIILLVTGENPAEENKWRREFSRTGRPVVEIVSKTDLGREPREGAVGVSYLHPEESRRAIAEAILRALPSDFGSRTLLGDLVGEGDCVMLVMPQDGSAPKGRLIMPQVMVIRELLDRRCQAVCTVPEQMEQALSRLASPPDIIITDSQAFAAVAPLKPAESRLTSFSILMAAYKGDTATFLEGARHLDSLTPDSRILIAEACAHVPKNEDIGRVKIPAMLRRKLGRNIKIDFVNGSDFPDDLTGYDLIIHCGACMFNRSYVLERIARARRQNVPITNYGIAIAHLTGVSGKVVFPS